MTPILPGATIGIFGGGQLGRMTAIAARMMGYRVQVLDPSPTCAASAVVDRVIAAPFDDAGAAAELARGCDVVTLEIEQVSAGSITAAAQHAPVRPGGNVLDVVRDRSAQKRWLRAHAFPIGDYEDVTNLAELGGAIARLGAPLFVKAVRGGFDGRGQVRVQAPTEAGAAWESLAGRACVAERGLDLALELSVLVARRPSGETVVYPPSLNHHEHQVLAWSVIPAPIPDNVAETASELARGIATAIGLEGILAVELFLTRDGRLLVNELAPRPHNSYHTSEVACATSQFEQLVRAACDLPLGRPDVLQPGAIVNLFGDVWLGARPPAFDAAIGSPFVRLHLYGKGEPRAARKMGHLSAVGASTDEALARARGAFAALRGDPPA